MSFTTFLGAVGTGLSVFGQLQQGKQQQQLFEFNSAVSLQQAQLARESGRITQERLRKQKRSFTSKQTAAFAAAGVRLTGSPFQVLADTAAELEFDMMIEDFNTRVAVLNAQTSAQLELIKGQQARTSSIVNAGTTLLTQIPNFVSSANKGNVVGGRNIGGGVTSFGIPVPSRVAF
jgi:hypothetical protein